MTDLPRKLPPFVYKERSRHGRVVLYFRRGKGARVRLPDDPHTAAFAEAYKAALEGKAARRPGRMGGAPSGTLRWLVERFMQSGKWLSLQPATRKKHSRSFEAAIAQSGNARFRGITRQTVMRSMDARAETPFEADNFLKSLRVLFKWAVLAGYAEMDPTDGVPYFNRKTDGFKVWTAADVAAFCARWPVGTKPRLAFVLYLVSGLRRSDMHRLGPQHLGGDVISIRAAKPPHHMIAVRLPAFVLDTLRQTPVGEMAFMTREDGRPFTSKESFGNWFGARCREAGLGKGKAAHGIRKFSATQAANAGATTHELMAHFGWSNPQQAEPYTRSADRQRLALRSTTRMSDQYQTLIPRTPDPGAGKPAKNDAKTIT